MKILLAVLFIASAQAASWEDPADAEPAHDVRELSWQLDDDRIQLAWRLAAEPDAAASYTATVFVGTLNETEPHEVYIVQHGPGGQWLLTGHGDEPQTRPLFIAWNGSQGSTEFSRSDARDGDCAFGVMQTSTVDGDRQRQVEDQVPDGTPDASAAWKAGAPCLEAKVQQIIDGIVDDHGIPAISPLWLLAALVLARR